jgi:hypothetical protein
VAVVLLPGRENQTRLSAWNSFRKGNHAFLLEDFNGYNVASENISGQWKNEAGGDEYGEHQQ